jgi:hypothetical protein
MIYRTLKSACSKAYEAYIIKLPAKTLLFRRSIVNSTSSFQRISISCQSKSHSYIETHLNRTPSSPHLLPRFPTNSSHKMSSTSYPQSSQLSSSTQYYDADSPLDIATYARSMHQHTKKQMEAAAKSAWRRTPELNGIDGINAHGTLVNEGGSTSSLDSRRSS